MKRTLWICLASTLMLACGVLSAVEDPLTKALPVRGLCIAAPRPNHLDAFLAFVQEALVPRKVNTLILRVDFNFEYASHPELRDGSPLTKADVKRMVDTCKPLGIRLIPQINLLGHQSWAKQTGNLLRVYPEFDETPWVKMPENYKWPNPDGLYCKSYCPLHPKVHEVVFALVDELCDAFETDAYHAGLDEVFYIGDSKCPRCAGKDKSELFAGEVKVIRDHLAQKGRKLWMWGDRLLDGKTTGIGEWEASINDTHRAIDFIPKDVVICDWHYERPDQTAAYFALKGFQVVTCPWKNPKVGALQVQDIVRFRNNSTPEVRNRLLGIVQTVWSGPETFLDEYSGKRAPDKDGNSAGKCFITVFDEIAKSSGAP